MFPREAPRQALGKGGERFASLNQRNWLELFTKLLRKVVTFSR